MIARYAWDPFESLIVHNTLDWLLDKHPIGQSQSAYTIEEDGEGYTIRDSLPGIDPQQLEISLAGQTLTIRGELKEPQLPEGVRYHLRERAAGQVMRSFRFPLPVDADAIQAQYEHGVLTIRMPKAEQAKARRISVQAQPALTPPKPLELEAGR
jgi:HSP20 family molecular chaperone IbpA